MSCSYLPGQRIGQILGQRIWTPIAYHLLSHFFIYYICYMRFNGSVNIYIHMLMYNFTFGMWYVKQIIML